MIFVTAFFLLQFLLCNAQIEQSSKMPIIGVLSQETYSVQNLYPDEDFLSFVAASYVKFVEAGGARILPICAPVIGVLSQETFCLQKWYSMDEYKSFIAASYVKFVECGGGRVLPIWIGRDESYYRWVINNTNGVLFPGGATWFNQSDGYADAGQYLYDIALELNQKGDYYPIWGTCLGMELLLQAALHGEEIRAHCDSHDVSLPLDFVEDFRNSRLFSPASDKIIDALKTKNVTVNNHGYCFTQENFTLHNLDQDWRIMSYNNDDNGLQFISSYEHKLYPFYGVQFHPEKNPYEFNHKHLYIEHTKEAIEVSQYFSNFIVEEARKNDHKFSDVTTELDNLIYNYAPRFSALQGSSYQQLYLFTAEENQKLV